MKNKIIETIKEKNDFIPFDTFMRIALYDQDSGYYTKNKTKVGAQGDFYTSVSVSPVFGEVLSNKILTETVQNELPLVICELGAGTGMLAQVIQRELGDKIEKYIAVESSPFHRKQIEENAPGVEVLGSLDELTTFSGIIISNEFFDALPTKVAEFRNGCWNEVGVTVVESELMYTSIPATGECLDCIHFMNLDAVEGMRIEVPLEMFNVYGTLCRKLVTGSILSIDYGVSGDEFLNPNRLEGSLRGFKDHQLVHNVLEYPGEMDITYNVPFDILSKYGELGGMKTINLMKQNKFLVENGILELLSEHQDSNPFSKESKRNRAIIQFISSESLSNYFYVLEQRKE